MGTQPTVMTSQASSQLSGRDQDAALAYYVSSLPSAGPASGPFYAHRPSSPLLSNGSPTNSVSSHSSDRCRLVSIVLLIIRCSYLSILLVKLFLKFVLIPWLFFHRKPYGDLGNVSMETVTLFLWLVLIYMTIFVIIGIIGILDDNLYLVTCFLFLMDMEIIICLCNDYIDSNHRTIGTSIVIVTLTFLYLVLVMVEKQLLRKHRHEHPVNYV
ncbi:hypothetical protein HDE_04870 [Halotydeus destructor]|nr:hypothetical protein HDE_04870 [Halotydeus destructor]